MTANQIAYQKMSEERRHNKVSENETARHNFADEAIRETANIETHRSNVINENETMRSNKAREAETNRANIARETETHRTNVANESLRGAELDETKRHNTVSENLTAKSIKAGISSSLIASSGSVTAAGIAAGAAKYAADTNRAIQTAQQDINRMEAETRAATQRANEEYNLQKIAIERQRANVESQESASRQALNENKVATSWLDSGSHLINNIINSASVLHNLRR